MSRRAKTPASSLRGSASLLEQGIADTRNQPLVTCLRDVSTILHKIEQLPNVRGALVREALALIDVALRQPV